MFTNTSVDKLNNNDFFYLNSSSSQFDINPKRAITDNLFDFHISQQIESTATPVSCSNSNGNGNDNNTICGIDQFVDYINCTLKGLNKFHENSDLDIIRKNNNYLYYLSKVGIKCMGDKE